MRTGAKQSGDGWQVLLPFDGLLLVQGKELLAIDRHVARGFDTEANLTAIDVHDRDTDVVADKNLLPELTTEYEHGAILR
jgi:hypothetical protein